MLRAANKLYDSNMENPTIHPAPRSGRIHAYSLFGESADLPDVVHCETLAARSSLHDWELAPHRHPRLHQVLLVSRGGGTAWLDDEVVPLAAMSLVNVPPGTVHAFKFKRATQGWVITLADELLGELLLQAGDARRMLARAGVVLAQVGVLAVVEQLATEFSARQSARALVLRGQCAVLLGHAARAIAAVQGSTDHLNETNLVQRFEEALEAHYLEHWTVADYARELAVTTTHLSRVLRSVKGQPTSRLIEERMAREARSQLAYTRLRVKTVADTLGFTDPAYFTRVFTRAVGVSPREYRMRFASKLA